MEKTKEYQVSARKYRPQYFRDVIGQEAIVTTLKHAIHLSRIAHAYLFCGTKGTGKTTLARLFAKAINCPHLTEEGEPCNICSSCKEIASGHALDVLEIDGASNRGIEDIRRINETVAFAPVNGKYKIYLIDEVHMLTKEAFNALLKTLEEPPSHVKFFFATTEAHRIPATILSRCQRFQLNRISSEHMCNKLQQIATDLSVTVDKEALTMIAELSSGSLRDAESLFDQIVAFKGSAITLNSVIEALGLPQRDLLFALDEAVMKGELIAAFTLASEVLDTGKNVSYFLEELVSHFRTLFLSKHGCNPSIRDQERYQKTALRYKEEELIQILEIVMEAQTHLKGALSEKSALEMLLLRIVRLRQHLSLEQLVTRLTDLEKNITERGAVQKEREITLTQLKETPKAQVKEKVAIQPAIVKKESAPVDSISQKQESVETPPLSSRERAHSQSQIDTILCFAAKELNGFIK